MSLYAKRFGLAATRQDIPPKEPSRSSSVQNTPAEVTVTTRNHLTPRLPLLLPPPQLSLLPLLLLLVRRTAQSVAPEHDQGHEQKAMILDRRAMVAGWARLAHGLSHLADAP